MNQDGTIALFQYWDRLRGNRAAPLRTEIEPGDIRKLLADTFILEQDTRGQAIFRLAGTRLCAAYGRELKGYGFALLWARRDQSMMTRLVRNVFEDNSVVVVTFIATSEAGRGAGFEMILLPLDGGKANRRLLGCLQPRRVPFWLGADPIASNGVETIRVVDPDREPLFLKNRPPMPVSSASGDGELVSADAARRIRHLVVIEGGKTPL